MSDIKELLKKIENTAVSEINSSNELKDLELLRVKYLGKKGELTLIMRSMGDIPKEERPYVGQLSNETRQKVEKALSIRLKNIKDKELKDKLLREKIDVTATYKKIKVGHRHPLSATMRELEILFKNMGFTVVDGPEIETVENNFNKLNAPMNHPSREKSDTFYINDDIVLRTQTSPVQIRTMLSSKPPIRIISAGKTFRFDDVDDTHSPMFHQIEGLVVDEHVSVANLIDTINTFVKAMFGDNMKTRFRPHYFPFTEPSMEVDVSCHNCGGKGCKSCNNTGWSMELLGCGMVHPKVLEYCNIDSKKYSGFAFGMGVDRITMVKNAIKNIRLLTENDTRFLKQF